MPCPLLKSLASLSSVLKIFFFPHINCIVRLIPGYFQYFAALKNGALSSIVSSKWVWHQHTEATGCDAVLHAASSHRLLALSVVLFEVVSLVTALPHLF